MDNQDVSQRLEAVLECCKQQAAILASYKAEDVDVIQKLMELENVRAKLLHSIVWPSVPGRELENGTIESILEYQNTNYLALLDLYSKKKELFESLRRQRKAAATYRSVE